MAGEHLLVARHYRQTFHQRALYNVVSRIGIVNEFDDEVNLRVGEYLVSVVREECFDGARFVDVAYADSANLDIRRFDTFQNVVQTIADRSKTEESDL